MSGEGMYVELHTQVERLADIFDGMDIGGDELFGQFNCSEIDVLADVLTTAGRAETAEQIVAWHAERDDRGDSHWLGERFVPGQKVVYRAPHVTPDLPGEEGVVTRDEGRQYVFVRFGNDVGAKSVPRSLLWSIGGGQ